MEKMSNYLKKSVFWKRVISLLMVFAMVFTGVPMPDIILATETQSTENSIGEEVRSTGEDGIEITMHFRKPSDWSNLYAHIWYDNNGSDVTVFDNWPGLQVGGQSDI
ncbi:MAG: starch-binding protein, partial [Lachnospiraceae bacterium]|nr:starch-binding protein [Lachnospiraceae bacterium]